MRRRTATTILHIRCPVGRHVICGLLARDGESARHGTRRARAIRERPQADQALSVASHSFSHDERRHTPLTLRGSSLGSLAVLMPGEAAVPTSRPVVSIVVSRLRRSLGESGCVRGGSALSMMGVVHVRPEA